MRYFYMKTIPNFPEYSICKSGRVFSHKSKRYLKNVVGNCGYLKVTLRSQGKRKYALVHRLLAEAYLPNPDNKPEVNHIDGNRANCSLRNLEWVTPSENVRHAHKLHQHKNSIDYKFMESILHELEHGEGTWATVAEDWGVDPSGLRKLFKRDFERKDKASEFERLCTIINSKPQRKGDKGKGQKTLKIRLIHEDTGEVLEFNSLNDAGRYFEKSPATFHKALKKSRKFNKQYRVESIGHGRS